MITAILTAAALIVPMQDVTPPTQDVTPPTQVVTPPTQIVIPPAQDQPPASQPATPQKVLEDLSIPEILSDAETLLQQGEISMAVRAFREVLSRDVGNLDAILGVARVAELQDDFNTARSLYMQAREIDQTDFRVNYRLGSAYLNVRFYRQGLLYLEDAEESAPADKLAELKTRMAIAYRGTGARSKAKEYASAAVALDPENYTAREVLVVARLDDEEYDRARGDVEFLVDIARKKLSEEPSEPRNVQFLISALDRKLQVLNKYHLSLYEKDPSGNPTDRLLPGQAAAAAASLLPVIEAELQKGELANVLRMHNVMPLATRAVEYDPSNAELWETLAWIQFNTSQIPAAIESFQKVVELDPNHARAAEQLKLLNAPLKAEPVEEQPAEAAPSEP